MSDEPRPEGTPQDETPQEEEAGAPYVIEAARSSRSTCKTCRKKIKKDALRLGIRVEGYFGPGYAWHHLECAARRHLDQVEEAYALEAWKEAPQPPGKLPDLEHLRSLKEKADEKRRNRKELPYAEIDPSGRARCKQCGEPMAKGEPRVVVGREVVFGQQRRVSPIAVHPGCVQAALDSPENATEREGLAEALRANSELPDAQMDEVIRAAGA